jgi:hypothetical protein
MALIIYNSADGSIEAVHHDLNADPSLLDGHESLETNWQDAWDIAAKKVENEDIVDK